MIGVKYNVPVTRDSVSIGSFWMTLYFTDSFLGRRSQIVPQSGHALTTLVASEKPGTDRRVGDVLDLTGTPWEATIGTGWAKVIDPCPYRRSVQSALQRIALQRLAWWTQTSKSSSVNESTLNVLDVSYSRAGTVLAYMEPMGAADRVLELGHQDLRGARCYSTTAIAQNDALVDFDGSVWVAKTASQHSPVINDYITGMELAVVPPAGIES